MHWRSGHGERSVAIDLPTPRAPPPGHRRPKLPGLHKPLPEGKDAMSGVSDHDPTGTLLERAGAQPPLETPRRMCYVLRLAHTARLTNQCVGCDRSRTEATLQSILGKCLLRGPIEPDARLDRQPAG